MKENHFWKDSIINDTSHNDGAVTEGIDQKKFTQFAEMNF